MTTVVISCDHLYQISYQSEDLYASFKDIKDTFIPLVLPVSTKMSVRSLILDEKENKSEFSHDKSQFSKNLISFGSNFNQDWRVQPNEGMSHQSRNRHPRKKIVEHKFETIVNIAFVKQQCRNIFKCLMKNCKFTTLSNKSFEKHLVSHLNDGELRKEISVCHSCQKNINGRNLIAEFTHLMKSHLSEVKEETKLGYDDIKNVGRLHLPEKVIVTKKLESNFTTKITDTLSIKNAGSAGFKMESKGLKIRRECDFVKLPCNDKIPAENVQFKQTETSVEHEKGISLIIVSQKLAVLESSKNHDEILQAKIDAIVNVETLHKLDSFEVVNNSGNPKKVIVTNILNQVATSRVELSEKEKLSSLSTKLSKATSIMAPEVAALVDPKNYEEVSEIESIEPEHQTKDVKNGVETAKIELKVQETDKMKFIEAEIEMLEVDMELQDTELPANENHEKTCCDKPKLGFGEIVAKPSTAVIDSNSMDLKNIENDSFNSLSGTRLAAVPFKEKMTTVPETGCLFSLEALKEHKIPQSIKRKMSEPNSASKKVCLQTSNITTNNFNDIPFAKEVGMQGKSEEVSSNADGCVSKCQEDIIDYIVVDDGETSEVDESENWIILSSWNSVDGENCASLETKKEKQTAINCEDNMIKEVSVESNKYSEAHELMPWAMKNSRKNFKVKKLYDKMASTSSLIDIYKCMSVNCCFTTSICSKFLIHLEKHQSKLLEIAMFYDMCAYCNFSHYRPGKLAKHVKTKHIFSCYQCSECFYRCVEKETCYEHMREHHSDGPKVVLKCSGPKCTKTSIIERRNWMRAKHVLPIECKDCDEEFYVFSGLENHKCLGVKKNPMRRNKEVHLYECIYCFYGASSSVEISKHMVIHPTESRVCCVRVSSSTSEYAPTAVESTSFLKIYMRFKIPIKKCDKILKI